MTLAPLSPEDRKVLERKYFWLWTVYKRMLGGLAVVFGGLWLWVGWGAWHDASLRDVFGIVSVLLVLLASFGWWSTPVYRRRHALPLQSDLAGNEKIRQTGMVTAVKLHFENNTHLLFQAAGVPAVARFVLDLRAMRQFPDLLTLNEEITLEYSPEARVILAARLAVPHSAEAKAAEIQAAFTGLLGVLGTVGLLVLGLGWWLGEWRVFGGIYLAVLAVVVPIIWRHHKRLG